MKIEDLHFKINELALNLVHSDDKMCSQRQYCLVNRYEYCLKCSKTSSSLVNVVIKCVVIIFGSLFHAVLSFIVLFMQLMFSTFKANCVIFTKEKGAKKDVPNKTRTKEEAIYSRVSSK